MTRAFPAPIDGLRAAIARSEHDAEARWSVAQSVATARALRHGRPPSETELATKRTDADARRWGRFPAHFVARGAPAWQRRLARAVTCDDTCVELALWLVCAALLQRPRAERASAAAALPSALAARTSAQFLCLRARPTLLESARDIAPFAAPALAAARASSRARPACVAALAACFGVAWSAELTALDPSLEAWPWWLALEEPAAELVDWWSEAANTPCAPSGRSQPA